MISKQSLEILIDLVEIKLSSMMILDKEDMREWDKLKNCKREIHTLLKTYAKHDDHGIATLM